jgi:cytochrome b561
MNHAAAMITAPWPEWKDRLITAEDAFHIHKTLGLLVVLSTIFRLVLLLQGTVSSWRAGSAGDDGDMGFRSHPQYTVPTVLVHLSLNLTAFRFALPVRRITTGYRIWPEYRLHSLVFLFRSLVAILLFWSEQQQQPGLPGGEPAWRWPPITHLFLVLLTMALADLASASVVEKSGFARNLDALVITRYFFSLAQLGATAYVLLGYYTYGSSRSVLHFVMIMIIQFNAFFMTLQRKNLVKRIVLVRCYLVMLIVGILTARPPPHVKTIAHLAALIRLGPRYPALRLVQENKYVMWTMLYLLHEYGLAPYFRHRWTWFPALFELVTLVPVLLLGYYKHTTSQDKEQPPRTDAIAVADHDKNNNVTNMEVKPTEATTSASSSIKPKTA